MANDAWAPGSPCEYYAILKDTLIAHEAPALAETRKRKAISTSRYCLYRHRAGLPPSHAAATIARNRA